MNSIRVAVPSFLAPSVRRPLLVLCLAVAAGCADTPDTEPDAAGSEPGAAGTAAAADPQATFWASLESLCGQAFEGRVVESEPPDASFEGQRLVMHVRECSADAIRVPFHVGADRSRTWVFSRTPTGLRLKHDHRHEDGTEDEITQYGGDTRRAGTALVQEFHADRLTAELVPAAATNVWTVEVDPGRVFAYDLRREDGDRRFRAEFDLEAPVTEPPAPWGASDRMP